VLAFVGVVTFLRLVQSSIEAIAHAHRIGLLRSFYLRLSPELEPYIVPFVGEFAGRTRFRRDSLDGEMTHRRLSNRKETDGS
jgi:hypothetical protein